MQIVTEAERMIETWRNTSD